MHIGSWNTTPPPQKKAKKYLEIMMFSLSKDYIKKKLKQTEDVRRSIV